MEDTELLDLLLKQAHKAWSWETLFNWCHIECKIETILSHESYDVMHEKTRRYFGQHVVIVFQACAYPPQITGSPCCVWENKPSFTMTLGLSRLRKKTLRLKCQTCFHRAAPWVNNFTWWWATCRIHFPLTHTRPLWPWGMPYVPFPSYVSKAMLQTGFSGTIIHLQVSSYIHLTLTLQKTTNDNSFIISSGWWWPKYISGKVSIFLWSQIFRQIYVV